MTSAQILEYIMSAVRRGDYAVSGEHRLVLDCPFSACRGSSRKPRHFYVNREWYTWRCYRTGESGCLRDEAMGRPGSWRPVRAAGGGGPDRGPAVALEEAGLVPLSRNAGLLPASQVRRLYAWLEDRGLTAEQVDAYRVAARPWDHRVWFPYWEPGGRVTFRTGRTTLDDCGGPKTVEEGTPDKPLFGSHVRPPHGLALLVEGFFDHVATPDSFATLGSALTHSQIGEIDAWIRGGRIDRVWLVRDPDAKDRARADVLALRRVVPAAGCLFLEAGGDPDELGAAVMREVWRYATSVPAARIEADPFRTVRC